LNKIIENILFIIIGTGIIIPILFKIIEIPELFMILLVFIGLAAVLNGTFNLIYLIYSHFKHSKTVS